MKSKRFLWESFSNFALHCVTHKQLSLWKLYEGPVHTGRRTPRNRHMQIFGHIVVNGSVHTGCKQHQRVCTQFARKSAHASCVNGPKASKIHPHSGPSLSISAQNTGKGLATPSARYRGRDSLLHLVNSIVVATPRVVHAACLVNAKTIANANTISVWPGHYLDDCCKVCVLISCNFFTCFQRNIVEAVLSAAWKDQFYWDSNSQSTTHNRLILF